MKIIWSRKSIFRLNENESYLNDISSSDEIGKDFKKSIYEATRIFLNFPNSGRIVPEFFREAPLGIL